jgi:hypothetical protein
VGEGLWRSGTCDHDGGLVPSGRRDGLGRGETACDLARRPDGDLWAPGPGVAGVSIGSLIAPTALARTGTGAKRSVSRQPEGRGHN